MTHINQRLFHFIVLRNCDETPTIKVLFQKLVIKNMLRKSCFSQSSHTNHINQHEVIGSLHQTTNQFISWGLKSHNLSLFNEMRSHLYITKTFISSSLFRACLSIFSRKVIPCTSLFDFTNRRLDVFHFRSNLMPFFHGFGNLSYLFVGSMHPEQFTICTKYML